MSQARQEEEGRQRHLGQLDHIPFLLHPTWEARAGCGCMGCSACLCTTLHAVALLCIPLHLSASLCTTLHRFAPLHDSSPRPWACPSIIQGEESSPGQLTSLLDWAGSGLGWSIGLEGCWSLGVQHSAGWADLGVTCMLYPSTNIPNKLQKMFVPAPPPQLPGCFLSGHSPQQTCSIPPTVQTTSQPQAGRGLQQMQILCGDLHPLNLSLCTSAE